MLIEIDADLYKEASTRVENISQFIEQQLTILVNDEFNEEFQLLNELSQKMDEIKEIETRLTRIRKRRIQRVSNDELYEDVLVTINRIHDNLGMIGKNQIKSIAKRNNVSYDGLLDYLKKNGEYEIVNFTGVNR